MKKLQNNNLKKNIIWNTIGSFTISITSLIYTIILTRNLNLSLTGIFSFGFTMACVSVTLASFGGRTFQITDNKNEISTSTYILCRIITIIMTLFLILIYIIFKNYSFLKSFIIIFLCIFKYFEELSDVYYGIMQKNNKLYAVGKFQFFKSIFNMCIFFFIINITKNLIISVLSITFVNVIFVFIFERSYAKKIENWNIKVNKKEINKYFKVNSIICIFTFLTNYIINAPKYAIDKYLTDSFQAIFGIIVMPATMMMLIGSFIINPVIVEISSEYAKKNYEKINLLLKKIIFLIIIIGIIGVIICYMIGVPFLNFIYNKNFSIYKTELIIIVFGSIIYTISAIISNILTAMRCIKRQLYINIIIFVISFILSYINVKYFKLLGASISYSIIMAFRTIIYFLLYKKEMKRLLNEKNNIKFINVK